MTPSPSLCLRLLAGTVLAAVTSVAAASGCVPAQSAPSRNPATGKLEINLGNCVGYRSAWGHQFDGKNYPATFYSDLNANYWLTGLPSLKGQGAHWELRGAMPDARFASLQAYSSEGETLGKLFDQDFKPAAGSINWIRQGGRYPGASAVQHVVRLRGALGDPQPVAGILPVDLIKLAGSQLPDTFMLAYRVYPNERLKTLPQGMDTYNWEVRGQVPLPQIVYVIDNPLLPHYRSSADIFGEVNLSYLMGEVLAGYQQVGKAAADFLAEHADTALPLWTNPVRWEASAGLTVNLRNMVNAQEAPVAGLLWRGVMNALPNFSGFPNSASRYMVGGVSPARGEALVVRFKAPTVADPDRGQAMLASDVSPAQVRYWSVCVNNTVLVYATGCLKDTDMAVDAQGYVTLVLTADDHAPFGPDGLPARNWLRHGSPNELVLIRYMLASDHFTQSPLNYEGDATDLAALAAFMGEYYQRSAYCSLADFRRTGCREQLR